MKNYSASGLSPAFVGYSAQIFKKIRRILAFCECRDVKLSRQYYYWSGFFTDKDDQKWYISSLDWRDAADRTRFYIRKVKDYNDFVGSQNIWLKSVDQIPDVILPLYKRDGSVQHNHENI